MRNNEFSFHEEDCQLFAAPFIIEGRHCTCGARYRCPFCGTYVAHSPFGNVWCDQCDYLIETNKFEKRPLENELRIEIDRLRALVDKTYCAYCGAEFLLDGTAASMVTEHIKTCEKHPMRKVEDLLSATELALDASNTHIRQLEREIMELRGTLP